MYLLTTRLMCCSVTLSVRLIQVQRLIAACPCDQRPSMHRPLQRFNSAIIATSGTVSSRFKPEKTFKKRWIVMAGKRTGCTYSVVGMTVCSPPVEGVELCV
jgi:hypothetical protein